MSNYNDINLLHWDHEHGPSGCLVGKYSELPSYGELEITWETAAYCPPIEPVVAVPEVPIPAAGWLLMSALVGLVWVKRVKTPAP